MDSIDSVQLYVAIFQSVQLACNLRMVAATLIVYEYVTTIGQEVELFWTGNRKATMGSILFFVNRYLPLLVNLMYLKNPVPVKSCALFIYTSSILQVLQYLPWAIFSALRAYLLSARALMIGLSVFLLSLVPFVLNLVFLGQFLPMSNSVDCRSNDIPEANQSIRTDMIFLVVSRTCDIMADILVVWVTWKATYTTQNTFRECTKRVSLSSIMFQDGVTYFLVLLLMNVLHLSFSLRSIANADTINHASIISFISDPLTAILISRFLMDLQQSNHAALGSSTSFSSTRSLSCIFNISPLASSLPPPNLTSANWDATDSDKDLEVVDGDTPR
ncbi:hypothetical protein C8Q76DRAFT_719712 [Earliella scabrosa]|nr:hypothetical protein C8Q76DRAFT_719712 [Earliella scabrosa]